MLKAYAVALVLSTTAPVADKNQDAHKAEEVKQTVAKEAFWRPRRVRL